MFPADIWEYPIPKIGHFSFRFLGKTLDEIQALSGPPFFLLVPIIQEIQQKSEFSAVLPPSF